MNTNKLWGTLKWLGILWMLGHCAACNREYLRYDTSMKDAIFMSGKYDTIAYDFIAGAPESEYQYKLWLQVMGMPKPYERTIRIEIIDSLTTAQAGIHYQLNDSYTFPKDTVEHVSYITLFRDKDPELRERPVVLAFQLVESDDFSVIPVEGMSIKSSLTIGITTTPRPGYWSDTDLGPYTEKAAYMFMKFFHEIKGTNPILYERLTTTYGENLQWVYTSDFWWTNRIPVHKYVVRPLYDYYQLNPDPDVNIPEPQF